MEALGRVELPTNGLGNRCSIHLSYRAARYKLLSGRRLRCVDQPHIIGSGDQQTDSYHHSNNVRVGLTFLFIRAFLSHSLSSKTEPSHSFCCIPMGAPSSMTGMYASRLASLATSGKEMRMGLMCDRLHPAEAIAFATSNPAEIECGTKVKVSDPPRHFF